MCSFQMKNPIKLRTHERTMNLFGLKRDLGEFLFQPATGLLKRLITDWRTKWCLMTSCLLRSEIHFLLKSYCLFLKLIFNKSFLWEIQRIEMRLSSILINFLNCHMKYEKNMTAWGFKICLKFTIEDNLSTNIRLFMWNFPVFFQFNFLQSGYPNLK
jgi:hypothetical protein